MTETAVVLLAVVALAVLLSIRAHVREWHTQWEMDRSIERHNSMMSSLADMGDRAP